MAVKRGGQSNYDPIIGEKICERIALGEMLTAICKEEGMPARATINGWVLQHKDFAEMYARARSLLIDVWSEEIVTIADDSTNDWVERLQYNGGTPKKELNGEHVQRSKLRVDSRKWLLSKLRPETYGDKLDHSIAGVDGKPIQHSVKVSYVDGPEKDG